MIEDIENPIERFVAFIEERENIRLRRESGKPYPWTQEPILQTYRFTNINRENDAVSKHYQKTVRSRYGESPIVFPATVFYRWFNRISTCDAFFNRTNFRNNSSAFEEYIYKTGEDMSIGDLNVLLNCLQELPPPHVTGSYIVTGKPGYPKGEGVLRYFYQWCHRQWRNIWINWRINPPLLSEIDKAICSDGLGSFMRAQIIADLKYLPFLRNVPDWWTWAAPGPGSMRGLNIVLNQLMEQPWNAENWLIELCKLNDIVTPMLEEIGIDRLHNQDLQNCLCEFSKFTKVSRGVGRPRQVFRSRGETC